MTGLFLGFLLVTGTRFNPQYVNQNLIDDNSGIEILDGWNGCGSQGFVAAHNRKPLGEKITALQTGQRFNYRGCLYEVEKKYTVVNTGENYERHLKPNKLLLQTCYIEEGETLFVVAKNIARKKVTVPKIKR